MFPRGTCPGEGLQQVQALGAAGPGAVNAPTFPSHSYAWQLHQTYSCPTPAPGCLTSALSTPRPCRKEPGHQDTPFLVRRH